MKNVNELILVDKQDEHFLKTYHFHLSKGIYPATNIKFGDKYKIKRLHQMIIGKKNGFVIDHINRNPLDNRRCNLRHISAKDNSRNISVSKRNTSGYSGIHWHKEIKRWRVRIGVDRKRINIGTFTSLKEAIKARLAAKEKYHAI